MTGPKTNSEFCFTETLNARVERKQNSLFPEGAVINCFVVLSDTKIGKKLRKNDLLDLTPTIGCARQSSFLCS